MWFRVKYSCGLLWSLHWTVGYHLDQGCPNRGPLGRICKLEYAKEIVQSLRLVGVPLNQDRDGWRRLVSAVMSLRVPWNAGNFLTSCKPVSFPRRTLHHGVSKCVPLNMTKLAACKPVCSNCCGSLPHQKKVGHPWQVLSIGCAIMTPSPLQEFEKNVPKCIELKSKGLEVLGNQNDLKSGTSWFRIELEEEVVVLLSSSTAGSALPPPPPH